MAEKNYYLRQGELGAVMGPKTMMDERGPVWSQLYSIKVNQPLEESPYVLLCFRSIQIARLFMAFTEKEHKSVARVPQNPESSPAEAVMLFWNNLLMKSVPTLPEEPLGDLIFKLPLTNGTWVLLDMSSVQRSNTNPQELLMYWSTDGESTLQTQQTTHPVFGNKEVVPDLSTKQIKDLVDQFVASEHFPKGKIISPMVAHVEETETGPVIVAYMPTAPKKEYEVEITTPTGEKYKGILVVDPSLAP